MKRNSNTWSAGLRIRPLVAAVAVMLLAVAGRAPAQDAGQVAPASPVPTQAASDKNFDYGAVNLRVGVWTDKADGEVYRKGDQQTVSFETNTDAYAVVYRIDTEGEVTVLWPRTRMDDGFVFGGHDYVLPVQGGPRLRVSDSEGEGFVEAIVSQYPFDLRALEVDFHQEDAATRYDYRVTGDPFLAINEVNYAITGLENADDYVVTNYASYYVHREVDHPRYLCSQCHLDDGTDYDPYNDTCKLNITVDYSWSNGWWNSYGYYPVYCYPAYVYVDPWTWRPWINFWYDPWWHCPTVSVCYWDHYCWPWYDSPYYRGNWHTDFGGHRRYRPLSPVGPEPRTKVREYRALPLLVKDGGRTATGPRSAARVTKEGRGGDRLVWRGQKPERRVRPDFGDVRRDHDRAGLRIRDGVDQRTVRGGEAPRMRHTAGDSRSRPDLVPIVGGTPGGGTRTVRGGSAGPGVDNNRGGRTRDNQAEGRTIRPVEPRQKGTRIWNTGRTRSGDAARRSEQVRPGGRSGGSDSSRDGARSGGDTRTRSGDTRTRSGDTRGGSSGKTDRSGGDTRTRGGDTRTRSGDTRGGSSGKADRSGGDTRTRSGDRGGTRDSGSTRGRTSVRSGSTSSSSAHADSRRSSGSSVRSSGSRSSGGSAARSGGSRSSGGGAARSSGRSSGGGGRSRGR